MVALSTVLSLINLGSLPAGGSITLASMLPIVIAAYRHGTSWGLISSSVASLAQMLTGLSAFSYVTTWQSIVAVALLDFIAAFAVYGLSGIFRKKISSQPTAITVGAFLSASLRYLCHVISGATVWAGLSIPDGAALLYSISYNATYMIPDTIILCIFCFYIASAIDFRSKNLTRIQRSSESGADIALSLTSGIVLLSATVFDTVAVFLKLQSESGEFDITLLGNVNWILVGLVTLLSLIVSTVLFSVVLYRRKRSKKTN